MALYMGPSSNFGYGGTAPLQGGQPPRVPQQPLNGGGASKTVGGALPPLPGSDAHIAQQQQNVLGAGAMRASGPSQGYDPAYLQNLATSIGGLFGRPGGGTMNINPLGDLSEISPSSGMEGNAPSTGLPLTLLQQALNGGGFAAPVSSPAPAPPSVKPKAPIIRAPSTGMGEGRYLL